MTGHRFALLVATATYEDPKFRQLRAPVHDIEALRAVLEDPQIGDFEVQTLFDAEHWVVTSEMEGFFADRSPEDFCLLFLSCHGVKDVTGRLHFAASTTRFSRLSATGISSAWVNEQLSRSRVKRAVILLDCCYSGAFTRGLSPRSADGMHVVETLEGRGRAVITASDAMEYAWEDDELTQDTARPSIFTRALVSGLGTGAADRDGDGQVTVEDLYGYVHEQVRRETPNQTPTMSVLEAQGDLVVARNPNPPLPPITPDPLPGDLVAAQFDQRSWVREAAVARLRALLVGGAPALAASAEMALEQYLADRDEAVRGAAQAALEQRASPPVEDLAVPPEVTRPDAAEAEGTAIGTPEPQPPEPEPEPAPASDEQPEPGGRSEDHEPAAPVLVAAWARWRALRAGSRAFGATALVMALALGGVGTWRLVSDRTEEEPDADIAEPADTSATDAPDEAGDDAGSADVTTVEHPVLGTQVWTDTGVVCAAGDVIDIAITGTIMHEQSPTGEVGPDGLTDPRYHQFNVDAPELREVNTVAVIGSLDQARPFFVVGSGTTHTCERDGVLHLGVNDAGVANNSGQFEAVITKRAAS